MFHPPSEAIGMKVREWSDGKWFMRQEGIDMADPASSDLRPQQQPKGVLSYLDLDVLMAITHHWIMAGMSPDGSVDVALPDVLRWMGFNSLAGAPYLELRASVYRLKLCRVSIWHREEEHLAGIAEATSTLLSSATVEHGGRRGHPSTMRVRISPLLMGWLQSPQTQQIDLDVYAYLARHPATRRIPLARVLYVHFSAFRDLNGDFSIQEGWIANRWGERQEDGLFAKEDALNPRTKLGRAFLALGKTGAMGCRRNLSTQIIHGKFLCPKEVPRLRDQPRQRRLFPLDTMAIAEAAARGEPEPQPRLTTACPAPAPAPVVHDDAAPLGRLLTACRVKRSLVDEAKNRGWSDDTLSRLLLVALWRASRREVTAPAGWAASIIRDGKPVDWTREHLPDLGIDVATVRAWAKGPGGPLADTTPKGARHLPTNKQETLG
jgi:hypothetical protein